jgi:hypothetical protein
MKKEVLMFALVLMLLGAVQCGGEKDEVAAQVKQMATETISKQCEIKNVEIVTGEIKDDSKPGAEATAGGDEAAYTAKVSIECGGLKVTLIGKITRNKETGELDYANVKEILNLYSD